MLKTRFIFNPRSGRNHDDPSLLARCRAFIAEHGLDARIAITERPRHATELARQAVDDGCGLIVAVGGDGTMNEVAQALVHTDAALGLIPCGSGNGLGRHLGIPGPGRGAFRTLLQGRIHKIDTGLANGLPFFNAMGVGFDAEISFRFNRLTRRGLPAYVRTALGVYFSFKPESFLIRNGTSLSTRAFLVTVANSDQYGNDAVIAPGARVDDGRLDLVAIKSVNLFNVLPLTVRLFTKTIYGSPSVRHLHGRHFTIERTAPGRLHTDGETHDTGAQIEVTAQPRSLNIMVPAESKTAAIATQTSEDCVTFSARP
ncbi:MAG TPA: diacylglycerol kinase family protein [Opitutaceae bacterium]|jgi:diacylglycerol kinase (ATP)|nr:diacylglycerol kinase family protein [Opitutaceae bacterium]